MAVTKAKIDDNQFLIDTDEEQTFFLDHLTINEIMEGNGLKILGGHTQKRYAKQ